MCNELKCAIQSTVDLININKPGMCKRNVQTGCTGYVHIAAMRMMENDGCFLQLIKLSPVDVMRLSLGAWWPEGRSSSSVSQFLPSRFWSAYQMAAEWKDGYRGDLSPWLFLQLCFLQRLR